MSETIKHLMTHVQGLNGVLTVPSDKSISHRSALLGALAHGKTVVHDYLLAEDTLSTLEVLKNLGVKWERNGSLVTIEGRSYAGIQPATHPLDVGNSGTTIRLISGLLASIPDKDFVLTGDASIQKRPMKRIIEPLTQMGGKIQGMNHSELAPLKIQGTELTAIDYQMPVASAQVKSALILAGLNATGTTVIHEKQVSRNHTEKMLPLFGGKINVNGLTIEVPGKQVLQGTELTVPGDISSAAFFIVAALIVPNSRIILKNVGLNHTRTGILDVIQQMGGTYQVEWTDEEAGNLEISHQSLHGTVIEGKLIPRLIDELPIIVLLATQAEGQTVVRDAKELRVKETDRIATVVAELTKMGADITATDDGFIINGPTPLHEAVVDSHGDHRLGMMLSIAALIATGEVGLKNSEAVSVSYQNFYEDLAQLY